MRKFLIQAACCLALNVSLGVNLMAADGGPGEAPPALPGTGTPAGLPALPGTEVPAAGVPGLPATPGFPAAPAGGGLPALPGMNATGMPGGLPGLPALPGATGTADANGGQFNTPPALTVFNTASDSSPGTTSTAASTADTYEFLFYHDEDNGVTRGRFKTDVARTLRKNRIDEIMQGGQQGVAGQPGVVAVAGAPGAIPVAGNPNQPGAGVPQAVAEWDFYYEQLELYSEYVSNKLLGSLKETELPEVPYDSTEALAARQALEESYNTLANQVNNDLYNENREFYERLEAREDRRRAFYDWLAEQQQIVTDWTRVWSREINGERWTQTGEIRRDDWYYGTNFGNPDPIAFEIDGKKYLMSRTPEDKLEENQLNVLSTNLTPYDIIDVDGRMKNREMERMRGTLVVPPIQPVAVTTRTLELVQ